MRFAYIDSQGNEVPIPSVEALGLRIELGAIGPDTELYDAQSDRWGPAHTHEIFHTLWRDSAEDVGFVAPPPPVAPAPPPPPTTPAAAPPPPETDGDDLAGLVAELGLLPGAPRAAPESPPAREAGEDLDLDLTLTDASEPPPVAAEEAPAEPKSAPVAGEAADELPADPLDFGTLTPLDLDQVVGLPDVDPGDASPSPPADAPTLSDSGFVGEQLLDFTGVAGEDGPDLDLPSEALGDAPPAWIEQTGPDWGGQGGEEEVGTMRFGPGGADLDADLGDMLAPDSPKPRSRPAPPPEQEEPRPRPSPPRRVRRRSYAGFLGWIVVLGLVGAGGYYGWQYLGSDFFRGRGREVEAVLPPVTIPEIPAVLEARLLEIGDRALDGTVSALHAIPGQMKLRSEPRNDWLSGAYLANASQFPDIEAYWTGIEGFVDRVRDTDASVFHDQFAAALAKAGIEGDTARMLQARADSGFLATRSDRFEAYAEMDDLVNAALDLHQFLLTNEEAIAYAPAAGGYSRDPVLEAVPDNKALGDEMWAMVDRITEALDALGSLDRVTTERLAAVLLDQIREVGFR